MGHLCIQGHPHSQMMDEMVVEASNHQEILLLYMKELTESLHQRQHQRNLEFHLWMVYTNHPGACHGNPT